MIENDGTVTVTGLIGLASIARMRAGPLPTLEPFALVSQVGSSMTLI
jgi:hypothetical protein